MTAEETNTLSSILNAGKKEFLAKGVRSASLRSIVKEAGVTPGAFYGYYKSKEELFEALVGEHYQYLIDRFKDAQKQFADLPHEQQPEVMGDISGVTEFDDTFIRRIVEQVTILSKDKIEVRFIGGFSKVGDIPTKSLSTEKSRSLLHHY